MEDKTLCISLTVQGFLKQAYRSEDIPDKEEQESGKDNDTSLDEEKDGEKNDKKSRNGGSRGGDRGDKSGGGKDRGSGGQGGQKRTSGQKGRSGPLFVPGFNFDFALEQATSFEPEEQLGYLMQVCEPHFLVNIYWWGLSQISLLSLHGI